MGRGRDLSTFGSGISERTISGGVEWLVGLKSIFLGMRWVTKEEFKMKLLEEVIKRCQRFVKEVIKRRCLRKVIRGGV